MQLLHHISHNRTNNNRPRPRKDESEWLCVVAFTNVPLSEYLGIWMAYLLRCISDQMVNRIYTIMLTTKGFQNGHTVKSAEVKMCKLSGAHLALVRPAAPSSIVQVHSAFSIDQTYPTITPTIGSTENQYLDSRSFIHCTKNVL